MVTAQGFWSYVHADDAAERGRIVQLAYDVVEQYLMITGDEIELFLDRDDIQWGEEWRSKIDESLSSIAFFIPVLTPRFFRSVECRRELKAFARKATQLGVSELVMPILYAEVPALHDSQPKDDAVGLVKQFQWQDWRHLRFESQDSPEYRGAVADLATRLAAAAATANNLTESTSPIDETRIGLNSLGEIQNDEDDAPGLLDRIAELEEVMPSWNETIQNIGTTVEQIGTITETETERLNAVPERLGMTARIRVIRALASRLNPPASQLRDLGLDFTSQLNSVDGGVRAFVEYASLEVRDDPAAESQVCEFFEMILGLAASVDEGLESLASLDATLAPMEKMSRDLRPVIRTIREGLTLIHEGRSLTNDWRHLIQSSPISCDEGPVETTEH